MTSSDNSLPSPAGLDAIAGDAECLSVPQTRGVAWVLRWAAAIGAILSSAAILTEFACCLAAEQAIARAARAGVLEATLPRATDQTVQDTVHRRLAKWEIAPRELSVNLEQNGMPVRGRLRCQPEDRFSIVVTVPASAILPAWLRPIAWGASDEPIMIRAERQVPGRTAGIGRP